MELEHANDDVALLRLPVELMVRVARTLTTVEFCRLRLVCKGTEQALFHTFRHEFFRKKQFMLTDESLLTLMDIALHPTLGPALEHVVFTLDHFTNPVTNLYSGAFNMLREYGTPADMQAWFLAYKRSAAANFTLLATGRATKLLAEAFSMLSLHGNLHTVDLRDFNSATRFRDGPHAPWRSYGATTLARQGLDGVSGVASELVSYLPTTRQFGNMPFTLASTAFAVLLRALAEAGVRPPNLDVILRNRNIGLADAAFDMTTGPPGLGFNSVEKLVGHFKKLHLDVQLEAEYWDGATMSFVSSAPMQTPVPPASYGHLLLGFIAAARRLHWLRLNFQGTRDPIIHSVIAFLGRPLPGAATTPTAPAPAISTTPRPPLSLLTRLDLGRVATTGPVLCELIARLPALCILHLRDTHLYPPNAFPPSNMGADFLDTLGSNARVGPRNLWADFFHRLADNVDADSLPLHTLKVDGARTGNPMANVLLRGNKTIDIQDATGPGRFGRELRDLAGQSKIQRQGE